MHKSKRAIDRIHYPAPARSSFAFAFLFTQDTVIRKTFRDLPAQICFRFSIGDRDVAAVDFGARFRLFAEILQRDVAGARASATANSSSSFSSFLLAVTHASALSSLGSTRRNLFESHTARNEQHEQVIDKIRHFSNEPFRYPRSLRR